MYQELHFSLVEDIINDFEGFKQKEALYIGTSVKEHLFFCDNSNLGSDCEIIYKYCNIF
jgi:hypothetical protein